MSCKTPTRALRLLDLRNSDTRQHSAMLTRPIFPQTSNDLYKNTYFFSGRPLYVSRFLYSDGHMIPGKAAYFFGRAYAPYGGKEYEKREWYVLVEHTRSGRKRGFVSRFEYPDLPGVKPLKRAPIINQ